MNLTINNVPMIWKDGYFNINNQCWSRDKKYISEVTSIDINVIKEGIKITLVHPTESNEFLLTD